MKDDRETHEETIYPYVSLQERVQKLPEALLLTAGYYASRVRALSRLLHLGD
jgi:hypothetical protein